MKVLNSLLVVTALMVSHAAFASSESCEWQTRKVRFNIEHVTNLDGDNRDAGQFGVIADLPHTERIFTGTISVYKECETTRELHLKEIKVPATARFSIYGLNLRGGSLGGFPLNTGFYIHNFSGKNLMSAIDMPFRGGKLAVTVAAALGVNPNASLLVSKSGMYITDMENFVAFGPAIALGVTASYARMKIYADFSSVSESDAQLLNETL